MAGSTDDGVPIYNFVDANVRRQEYKEPIREQRNKKIVQEQDNSSNAAARKKGARMADAAVKKSVENNASDKSITTTKDASTEVDSMNGLHDKDSQNLRAARSIPNVEQIKLENDLQGKGSHKGKRSAKDEPSSPAQVQSAKRVKKSMAEAAESIEEKPQGSSTIQLKSSLKSSKRTNTGTEPTEPARPVASRKLDTAKNALKSLDRQKAPAVAPSKLTTPRIQEANHEASMLSSKDKPISNLITASGDNTDTSDSTSDKSGDSSDDDTASNSTSISSSTSYEAGKPLRLVRATTKKVKTYSEEKLRSPKSEVIDDEPHTSKMKTGGAASRRKSPKRKKVRMQYLEMMLKNQHYEIMQLRAIINHYGLKGIQVDEALIRMRDKQTVEEFLLSIQGFVVGDRNA